MNSLRLLAVASFLAVVCHADPPNVSLSGAPQAKAGKDGVNYTIRVEWKDAKKGTNALQVVTAEGTFEPDTISGSVKVNDSEVPTTVKLSGTITDVNSDKGRLQLFLGRTVPFVTGSSGGPAGSRSSSYSQIQVGLQSTFFVTFGKPLAIQTDDNGEVTVLVKRGAN
jgi:hypothetical protein